MGSVFDDDEEHAGTWADQVLGDLPPEKVSKYREKIPYLDRTLEGLSESIKVNVLRVMVNLDLRADDPAIVLAILYGQIQAVGETIPAEMREASSEFRNLLGDFIQETQIFPQVVAQVQKRVADELSEYALTAGKSGVQAAAVEEIERMRIRVTSVAEEMLKNYLENAMADRASHSTDVLVVKHRTITTVCAVIVLLVGMLTGGVWGGMHGHVSGDQEKQMQYGRAYIRMYPSMPAPMREWISAWTAKHPTP